MKRILAYVLSLCMALLLIGCGQNNAQQDSSQGEDGDGEGTLKIALCLTGPANDGGWCHGDPGYPCHGKGGDPDQPGNGRLLNQ